MAIKKCKGCGALFDSMGLPFCGKCMQEIDYKYKIVRDYLYDNPNETIEQVSAQTDTPEWMIMYFLRDGRLNMANASGLLKCEKCGKPVTTGRFCPECAAKLGNKIQGAIPKPAAPKREEINANGKMHTETGR